MQEHKTSVSQLLVMRNGNIGISVKRRNTHRPPFQLMYYAALSSPVFFWASFLKRVLCFI